MNIESIHVFKPNHILLDLVHNNKDIFGSSEFIETYSFTVNRSSRSLIEETNERVKTIFFLEVLTRYQEFTTLLANGIEKMSPTFIVDKYWDYVQTDIVESIEDIWDGIKDNYRDILNSVDFIDKSFLEEFES
jgi:hypothetical protein